MAEFPPSLHSQDVVRLQGLGAAIGSSTNGGSISFEGEPIYADQPWSDLHDFSYGSVIPALAQGLPDRQHRLDVLYDDFTVESSDHSEHHFLGLIKRGLDRHSGKLGHVSVHPTREAEMSDRAQEWIGELKGNGVTTQRGRVLELHVPGHKPVALTARSDGRPTCAVLDAVYQTEKAERGVSTAVLVHSTGFARQQRDMQTVLKAVHGGLPLDSLVNIFIRERKGLHRLAAARHTDKAGLTLEMA